MRHRLIWLFCVLLSGAPLTPGGAAAWQSHGVRLMKGDAGCISLPAHFQIVTDSWNRVVAVPYIVYMPEKDRVLMLVSCDYPHRAMVLWSDDRGASWTSPKYVHTDSEGKPDTGMGVALSYLGNGGVSLLADGRWFSNDFGESWSGPLPVPPAPDGKVWNVWDPLLVEHDPKAVAPARLIETGYTMDYQRWESDEGPGYSQGFIRFSTDEARSWSVPVKVPEWAGVSEVALTRALNGDLVAACRTDKPAKIKEVLDHFEGLAVSISKDGGSSWSSLARLYEWGRHHPCLVVMPDGVIVMTFVVRKGYTGSREGFPRFGVEAIVSRDHGRTWDLDHRYLLHVWTGNRQGENGWWASSQATSTVMLADGSLLTAFGTGFRSQPAEGGPAPRDVGLVSWRLSGEPVNHDRKITEASFDSDLRNVFEPDRGFPCAVTGHDQIRVRNLHPVKPLSRAQRAAGVSATVENRGDAPAVVEARLVLPEGVHPLGAEMAKTIHVESADEAQVSWDIVADEPRHCDLSLQISLGHVQVASATLSMDFMPPVGEQRLSSVPEPVPVKTELLVGAHNCPLWESDRPDMWAQLIKHPERTPALGFYGQENPEVADWETKWAVEHGVSFFIYCWYRASQGEAVKMNFGSAIHDAFLKSRFADRMKFTIMWENQSRGVAGVSDERDLMENLLPFWMENYFRHPSYLKIDNKPLLFVYRPEFLIDDLGGVENVRRALDQMRQACRDAGFDGLYVLGEYRGLDPDHLKLMKSLGLDYTFAYCWHVRNNPTPEQAIAAQLDSIRRTQEIGVLPQVVTVSQGWSGWADEGSIWKLPPGDFKTLLCKAKEVIATFPSQELGSRMLLLDNWNEWGEGHYLAPHREYAFGYLDAVREVFAVEPEPHVDLIPEDAGLGPYDMAYQEHIQRETEMRKLVSKRILKAGAPAEGLIGWWAFDEDNDSPVTLDYSGNRLGGMLRDARRVEGIDGKALLCDGGCVEVVNSPRLSPASGLTIECWVKSSLAGQGNAWIVNRVFGGGTSTGYRLGILDGKPCFEVPLTDWSHHLKAESELMTGKWVHMAGTFDGRVERVFVDGEERGALERPGPVKPNEFHLCLGSYEVKHAAHFTGLLDEVKLYDRALPAETVSEHYREFADRASQ